MADLLATAVTVNRESELGDRQGKARGAVKDLTLALAGQGVSVAGSQIPATALGFSSLLDVRALVKDDNSERVLAAPSYDGSLLLLYTNETTPTTKTGTYKTLVEGIL